MKEATSLFGQFGDIAFVAHFTPQGKSSVGSQAPVAAMGR
jgi:hypothetical protein